MAEPSSLRKYLGTDGEGKETSISLPAWALEETQVKCLKKLQTVAKSLSKGGDNFNLLKEVKGAIDGNADAIDRLAKATAKPKQKTATKPKSGKNDTEKAADALADATTGQNDALMKLKKLANKAGGGDGGSNVLAGLAGKAGPFAIMGNMIGKVVGVLSKFVGALVAAGLAVTTFVASTLMKTFNLMNDSLSDGTAGIIGALTSGSTNVATQASYAGISLDNFTEALRESSEEIAVLGAEGYTQLRVATRDVAGGLFDMGYRNEEITKLLGREISIRARLGMRLDAEGTNLAGDVVRVATSLRDLGARAGISAEELYARSKLSAETESLLAARGRELGDDGISALQTSIRLLSMKMVAVSPTYADAITTPLVNAVLTGAVGLDDGFTDLVTVFPGLVKSFDMAKRDINNSGELSSDTISDIMSSLVDTTDEEFKRAKQLALMTRNQTAIQAVNFASEARARGRLIQGITQEGEEFRGRNISVIAAQMDTFFDMIKAPFENAVLQFAMGILGVSTTGEGMNFGDLIKAFSTQVQDFVENLPLIGNIFANTGFFNRFNDAVDKYFDAGNGQERANASAALTGLITETIDTISKKIHQDLEENGIGKVISDFFRNLIDDIRISIFETTGMMSEGAAMAYLRQGKTNKVIDMQERGLFGMGDSDALTNIVADMYYDSRDRAADQFGMTEKDFFGLLDANDKKTNKIKEKYDITDTEIEFAKKAAAEVQSELDAFWQKHGIDSQGGGSWLNGGQMTASQFESLVNDGDQNAIAAISDYARNQRSLAGAFGSYSGADFNASQFNASDIPGYATSRATLDRTSDNMRSMIGGSEGVVAAAAFKSVIEDLATQGAINLTDGIDNNEVSKITSEIEDRLRTQLGNKFLEKDGEMTQQYKSLLSSINRLIVKIDSDNVTTAPTT
tara:strand:+ start:2652 stop:5396 length:2745 start_codon:yes stop_codon:yes gene_type:complete